MEFWLELSHKITFSFHNGMPPMIGGPHYLSSSPIFDHKDKVGWGTFILPVKLFYFLFSQGNQKVSGLLAW